MTILWLPLTQTFMICQIYKATHQESFGLEQVTDEHQILLNFLIDRSVIIQEFLTDKSYKDIACIEIDE